MSDLNDDEALPLPIKKKAGRPKGSVGRPSPPHLRIKNTPHRNKYNLTERQEKFAQAYVMSPNATAAAIASGYSAFSAAKIGYSLVNNPNVVERMENIQKEVEEDINVETELETQYAYAKENNNTQTALKALELLHKMKGGLIEEAPLTISELEYDIVNCLEMLGEERASAIFLKCKWFLEQEEEQKERDASLLKNETPPSLEEEAILLDKELSSSSPLIRPDSGA